MSSWLNNGARSIRFFTSSGSALNFGFNFGRESSECLFDINSIFGWGFQEFYSKRVSQCFSFFSFHLSAGLKIWLVSDQQLHNVLIAILVHFGKPVFNVFEGLPICDIINEDDSMGSLVVWSCDRLKPFLASSIPNLKLDGASSRLESSDFEVNTDGGQETKSRNRYLSLKMLSENLSNRLDFPTEEFPMSRSLKR